MVCYTFSKIAIHQRVTMARPSYWVVCKFCGTLFDVGRDGGAYDGERHICKSCVKTVVTPRGWNGNIVPISQDQSWFKTNWKMLLGVLFLISGFGNLGQDKDAALTGIIIGAVLSFAHILPWIKAWRLKKAEKAAEQSARWAELDAKKAELQAVAEEPKRCKACGATTKGKICEYCGSLLE